MEKYLIHIILEAFFPMNRAGNTYKVTNYDCFLQTDLDTLSVYDMYQQTENTGVSR